MIAERQTREIRLESVFNLLVIQNPTREQARDFIKQVRGDLRMLRHPITGEMYVWEHAKLDHTSAAAALGIPLNDYRREYVTDGQGSWAKYVDLTDAPMGWFVGDVLAERV